MAARGNKRRKSKYKGCGLCKPHKLGYESRFKAKEKAIRNRPLEED